MQALDVYSFLSDLCAFKSMGASICILIRCKILLSREIQHAFHSLKMNFCFPIHQGYLIAECMKDALKFIIYKCCQIINHYILIFLRIMNLYF